MNLLLPLSLGRRQQYTAPCRIMFGPHETNLGNGRTLSDRHVAYYQRRSAGGAGIIVIEEASVHDSDWPYERAPLARLCGPGWRAITNATTHLPTADSGAVVLAGLGHSGGQGTSHWSQRELWAPSAMPEVASREVPKVMEQADIEAVIEGFGTATALAMASGCDGVEINAGQNSLIRQFLSGLTNMRTDPYGTDRQSFLREVLSSVRAHIGDGILALRLSADELAPWAGIVPEAGADIAVAVADEIDLLTIVRGSIYTVALTRPDGHVAPGFGIDLAREVRAAIHLATGDASSRVPVPVFAQGSIVDWGQAEWAITDRAADGVEMTRAQLADADLVAKLRRDEPERIRPCVLCNQLCKVRDNRNPIVSCVMDPRTGHELADAAEPTLTVPLEGRKSISTLTIIGAGVAGLETARIAALRGFTVHVYERQAIVGGTLMAASHGAGRERLAKAVDWLHAECIALGVIVETGRPVTPDMLAQLRDVGPVVIATGGRPGTLPFEVTKSADVRDGVDVLRDGPGSIPDGPIVVWDPIGGPIALSVAELLAADGRHAGQVTLVTPDLLVGEKLSLTGDLAPSQVRLHGAHIRLIKQSLVRRVRKGHVEVEDRFSGTADVIAAAVFIACGHRLPDHTLDPDETLPQVGDRVAPRTIHEAILDARRVALALPAASITAASITAASITAPSIHAPERSSGEVATKLASR